ERELEQLERERASRLDSELAGLESERAEAQRRAGELSSQADATAAELEVVEPDGAQARERRRDAHEQVEAAARAPGAVAVRLEETRERTRLSREGEAADSLSARLDVEPGYEAAVSA